MIRTLTIAASLAIALSTTACSDMRTWSSGDASDATGSTGSSGYGYGYSSDAPISMQDPAGTANTGTGSVRVGTEGEREAVSSGEGMD
ncbi:MAG: hypothetical protein ACXWCY_22625 [Burkholderiales bacterium]